MSDPFEEYANLKYLLESMHAYEPDMTLNEMRELMNSLIQSLTLLEEDLCAALPSSQYELLSSTMMDAPTQHTNNVRRNQQAVSPLSSPEVDHLITVLVEADVHHEQDWSPKKVVAQNQPVAVNRKRSMVDNKNDTEITSDDSFVAGPSAPKRALLSNTFKNPTDSGCSSGSSDGNSENDQSILNCDKSNCA